MFLQRQSLRISRSSNSAICLSLTTAEAFIRVLALSHVLVVTWIDALFNSSRISTIALTRSSLILTVWACLCIWNMSTISICGHLLSSYVCCKYFLKLFASFISSTMTWTTNLSFKAASSSLSRGSLVAPAPNNSWHSTTSPSLTKILSFKIGSAEFFTAELALPISSSISVVHPAALPSSFLL